MIRYFGAFYLPRIKTDDILVFLFVNKIYKHKIESFRYSQLVNL